jgi:hypothetical protein
MILVNFVRKQADSVEFPIKIKPTGWDKYASTKFVVMFFWVMGDLDSGMTFRYALDGDSGWTDL